MKIAYISFSTIPSRVANSIHTMQMCNAWAELGHEITLIIPDIKTVEKVENLFEFYGVEKEFQIKRLFQPDFKGRSTFYGLAVGNALRKMKPDIVIGRSIQGCAISAEIGIPTVFDSHGPVMENIRIRRWIFRRMISRKSFKRMTVNSIALKQIYEGSSIFKGTGFDPSSIVVAFNGAKDFPLDEYAELPGDPNKARVGYFGHLYAGRGIELIMDIARRLPNVNFYLVGGEEKDITVWKNKDITDNLFFIGYKPFSEVYKFRNSCDILIAPYGRKVSPEGTKGDQSYYMNPIKIIEYMSSRKPIISTGLATVRELLNDRNSILTEVDDEKAWVEGIQRLSLDRKFASCLADHAYDDFSEHYSWKSRAKALIDGLSIIEN